MRLDWRYCRCEHLITSHYVNTALAWNTCLGNGGDCTCAEFRDRSTISAVRWWAFRNREGIEAIAIMFAPVVLGLLIVIRAGG